jgi:O-6-methylguanine DNA methyltransferase
MDGQLDTLRRRTGRLTTAGRTPVHDRVSTELTEYFAGERHEFETPLATPGTPFQNQAWEALMQIPYGQTRSYSQQAAAAGRPAATRAVANANGRNRIAILVPCHRVVGADGKLTGYGGGLWRKQRLLDLEAGRIRF